MLTSLYVGSFPPTVRRFIDGVEVLDEQIIYECGPYQRVRRWLRGCHPDRGQIAFGLTGIETVEERDVIRATARFMVLP